MRAASFINWLELFSFDGKSFRSAGSQPTQFSSHCVCPVHRREVGDCQPHSFAAFVRPHPVLTPVKFQFVGNRPRGNPKFRRGQCFVAAKFLQTGKNHLPFDVRQHATFDRRGRDIFVHLQQAIDGNLLAGADDTCAMNDVAKFTDIAGPGISTQFLHGGSGDGFRLVFVFEPKQFNKVLDQGLDIIESVRGVEESPVATRSGDDTSPIERNRWSFLSLNSDWRWR